MFSKPLRGFAVAGALAFVAAAHAHGPQLNLTKSHHGKILTHNVVLEAPYSPSVGDEKSVYVLPVRELAGDWFTRPNNTERPVIGGPLYYSGPGIAFGSQSGTHHAFATGSILSLGFTTSLTVWDGAGFSDPGGEELLAFRGLPTAPEASATTSDSGPLESLAFPAVTGSGHSHGGDNHGSHSGGVNEQVDTLEAHATARYQLLGDGAAAPDDGLYLVGLSIASDEVGVLPSDEFFFLMNKNASADLPAALATLLATEGLAAAAVQVVPEPSAVWLSALLIAPALWRRK